MNLIPEDDPPASAAKEFRKAELAGIVERMKGTTMLFRVNETFFSDINGVEGQIMNLPPALAAHVRALTGFCANGKPRLQRVALVDGEYVEIADDAPVDGSGPNASTDRDGEELFITGQGAQMPTTGEPRETHVHQGGPVVELPGAPPVDDAVSVSAPTEAVSAEAPPAETKKKK